MRTIWPCRRDPKGWNKVRTLPGGIHNYDMIEYDGAAFAGLSTPLGALVARSTDGGEKWSKHLLKGKFRVRTVLVAGTTLLVSTSGAGVYEWSPSQKSFGAFVGELFPGVGKKERKNVYVQKAAWGAQGTAYIVAKKLM